MKNNNFSVIDEKYRVFVLPVFPSQAEIDLVEILKSMITSQITLTPIEVRRLGYELVCKKYKVSNLPEEKNCVLGQRWYREFTAKYPHTDMNHSYLHCQQDKSRNFYQALEDLVTANEIDSSRIFAVDAVELKFRASSMEDLKIFHKRKTIYTDAKAICCTNPNGCYVPPIFLKPAENINSDSSFSSYNDTVNDKIFNDNQGNVNLSKSEHLGTVCNKLKNLCNTSLKKLPTSEDLASIQKQIKIHLNKKLQPMSEENEEELREKLYEQFSQLKNKIISKYESSLNEVSNDIFFEWFQTFVKFVKPTPLKKVLLLLSEQNHVKCFKTLELAKASGVLFLALPPHTVHKIYPLDGFTMSLNRNLSTCAKRWLGKNPDFKVQQVPLHLLFKKGYSETVNPIIAKNGFLYSGIWPINKNIFESTELGGESLLFQKNSLTLVKKNCLKSSTGNER